MISQKKIHTWEHMKVHEDIQLVVEAEAAALPSFRLVAYILENSCATHSLMSGLERIISRPRTIYIGDR